MTPREVVLVVVFGFTGSRLVERLGAASSYSVLESTDTELSCTSAGTNMFVYRLLACLLATRMCDFRRSRRSAYRSASEQMRTTVIALNQNGVGTSRALTTKYRQVEIVPRAYFSIPNLKAES